jgi:threonine/homoserine/homoserine lactone efflux protein
MPDTTHLLLFLPAMAAITLLPGPDMLFVIAQSIRGGRRIGIVSVCGIVAGGVIQIGGAVVGLSALVLKSALAFGILKYLGAIYLIYLGIRTWREKTSDPQQKAPSVRPVDAFSQGFLTNALNPKVSLFILAFLPQFIAIGHASVPMQIAVFGAIWYGFSFAVLAIVALTAHAVGVRGRNVKARFNGKKITASIFIALGLVAAIPARR